MWGSFNDKETLDSNKITDVVNDERCNLNQQYSCQICFKHFQTEIKKCTHERKHNKKPKKFTCKICPHEIFNVEEEFLSHINDIHKGRNVQQFMCSKCGKQYKSKHDLTIHINSKCGTHKTFECQVCNQKFMTPGSLYNHKLQHKGAPSFMCRFCAKLFLTSGQLKIHERSHTKEKVFFCNVCGKGFCHRQSLITHSTIHTGIKPFVCENCEYSFSCVGNLLKHRKSRADSCGSIPLKTHRINHPDTKLKIKLNMPQNIKLYALQKEREIQEKINKAKLDKEIKKQEGKHESNTRLIEVESDKEQKINNEKISEPNSDSLSSNKFYEPEMIRYEELNVSYKDCRQKNDVLVNENEQTQQIEVNCGKLQLNKIAPKSTKSIIGKKNKVDEKIENEQGSDVLACKYCRKTYSNMKWLLRHEKQHNQVNVFNCRYCLQKCKTKEEYKNHQQSTHSDVLSCQQCDKIFANIDSLRSHKKVVHNGEQRRSYIYICEKCGKGYKQKSCLKVHEENNCDLGPFYECSICYKKLINSHVLKSHMLIHNPEKRLICKFCGKKFRWKGQLNIHERSHTGEKPYACLYCSKSFLYRESLLTHSTLHTGIKPFLCKACGLRFSCLSNLLSHKVTHASTCGEWYKKNQFDEKKKKE